MSLTGAEYMWIMSSIVLCKFEGKTIIPHFGCLFFLATYSSEAEPKMSPYDNPNRRKIDLYTGTLGLLLILVFFKIILSFFFHSIV
jgi:hypothetical protein